ncbi:MAG: acetylglutamate kinase [Acidimicrobiales bacterium]
MSRLIVKLGGHALDDLSPASPVLVDLAQDIAALRDAGTRVLVVHGGGPQIASLLDEVGLESRFHEGLRVTSGAAMRYVKMALDEVNGHITAAFNRAGLASVGLTGVDATLLESSPLGDVWGRAGAAPKVRTEIVGALWASGVTPVVSPVAVDDQGQFLNCNADTVAGALAGALAARSLVLLSDVDQLRNDPDDELSVLASANAPQVRALVHSGAARDGMRPKMIAALDALEAGAERVVLANGSRSHALRDALAGETPTTEVVR